MEVHKFSNIISPIKLNLERKKYSSHHNDHWLSDNCTNNTNFCSPTFSKYKCYGMCNILQNNAFVFSKNLSFINLATSNYIQFLWLSAESYITLQLKIKMTSSQKSRGTKFVCLCVFVNYNWQNFNGHE